MKVIIYIIIFIVFSGCGFKVINQSKNQAYNINEVLTAGEKRLNYYIKRDLIKKTSSNIDNINISLFIETTKTKSIKEKNNKNEITKYEINIIANVEVKEVGKDMKINAFTISNNGDFEISKQNSTTRNNEKNLNKSLSENIAKEIIFKLNSTMNDL